MDNPLTPEFESAIRVSPAERALALEMATTIAVESRLLISDLEEGGTGSTSVFSLMYHVDSLKSLYQRIFAGTQLRLGFDGDVKMYRTGYEFGDE